MLISCAVRAGQVVYIMSIWYNLGHFLLQTSANFFDCQKDLSSHRLQMSCQANSTELTFAREIQVQGINPCFGFDHLRSAVTSAIELTCSPVLPFVIRCHGVSSSACNGYSMPSSCLKCSQPQMLAVAKADSMPKLLQLVHFHSKSKSFVLQWLDLARL